MEPLYEPLSPRRFDELIDELCQVWDGTTYFLVIAEAATGSERV
jgi:hypothetical protein